MKISVKQFIEFAYGDKRKDKAKVSSLINEIDLPYDPAKDRYKKFREAMTAFEDRKITKKYFLELHSNVSANKAAGYKILCSNYVNLKEDYALTWAGRRPVEANISGVCITTAWYLRTEENNQKRIIFLHFGKEQISREKERGLLTVLRMAMPESAGVGILNIQPGTLVTATRLDQSETEYLSERAKKFFDVAHDIQSKK